MFEPKQDPLREPRLSKALLQLWSSRCAPGMVLERSAIDPVLELPRLVPHMLLLLWTEQGFQYRVVGTQVVQLTGRDVTDKYIDPDLYANAAQRLEVILRECCESGRAFVHDCSITEQPKGPRAEFVGIPLRPTGGTEARYVLGTFQIHGRRPGASAAVWDGASTVEPLWLTPDQVSGWLEQETQQD